MGANCFGCNFPIQDETQKYFIFERDRSTKRCLVFKIFQITGEECSIDMDESFVCGVCHHLLTEISSLGINCFKSFAFSIPPVDKTNLLTLNSLTSFLCLSSMVLISLF